MSDKNRNIIEKGNTITTFVDPPNDNGPYEATTKYFVYPLSHGDDNNPVTSQSASITKVDSFKINQTGITYDLYIVDQDSIRDVTLELLKHVSQINGNFSAARFGVKLFCCNKNGERVNFENLPQDVKNGIIDKIIESEVKPNYEKKGEDIAVFEATCSLIRSALGYSGDNDITYDEKV